MPEQITFDIWRGLIGATFGTEGEDHLLGDDRDDTMYGFDGDDRLAGEGGNDVLNGGAGNDRLAGGTGDNTLIGGDGDDVIEAMVGIDEWLDGNNWADGGAGDDVINTGNGVDTVLGGDGDDRLVSAAGNDYLDGGAGNDIIYGGAEDDLIYGGAGNDYIVGDMSVAVLKDGIVIGTQELYGDDVIYAGDGDDYVYAGEGNDWVEGGAGADMLLGGNGLDTVSYASSSQSVYIDLGSTDGCWSSAKGGDADGDLINGFENVVGSQHDDILGGDAGANTLTGLGGDDVLNGAAGDDLLLGGFGDDTFVLAPGGGHDTIGDFNAWPGSHDLIDVSAYGINFADLQIQDVAGGALVSLPGGDTVLLSGVAAAQLDADDFQFLAPGSF